MILLPVADRTIEETGLANNTNTCLSAHALSGIFLPAVQTNGRACHQQRNNDCGTAEGATPATAQAQELLAQANLESVGQPTTEGARNASCNLSGIKDRWGAARFRAAPFLF